MAQRIDVHHHLVAPKFVPSMRDMGVLTPHLASIMNENDAIADMDKGGVSLAVNSPTIPGSLKSEALTAYCRENNDYMARLAADYKGRFGMFAALPLPDIDATLAEIARAFDTLKADGVHMMTSYGDNWLGDKVFAPIFDELERRRAVIYTHPHAPNCCANTLAELDIRDSVIEFGTDTTRALTNYLFSGTAARCPHIRVIWSHGGGTMPFLVERFIRMEKMPRFAPLMPQGFLAEASKFYYDTAQILHGSPLGALKQIIPLARICYGTDYPWRGSEECVTGLKAAGIFSAQELAAIDANAAPLLPRFA
ncbi:MAG TPA: amidohydrolase family protein [Stellaceae bacterium]|nr:amidohydrolase family protein [Stellaceae bacterium]